MNAVGEIIECRGENALVKFKRSRACKNCTACISFSNDELLVELKNTLNADIGDRVRIVLHPRSVVRASLIAYGIPLLAFIAGALAGSFFGDIYTALCSVFCAAAAFVILRILEPRFERMSAFQPKMLSYVEEGDAE